MTPSRPLSHPPAKVRTTYYPKKEVTMTTDAYTPYTEDTYAEITNLCTCSDVWGNELDCCYGWCWDDTTELFGGHLSEWFVEGTYKIDGFPTWHGPVGGFFEAKTVLDLLTAITPDRTDWTLRYEDPVAGQPFTAILSHHDGSGRITVTPIPDLDE